MTIFPPKNIASTISQTFNFSSALAISETIASAVVTATVFSGEDASPASIIDGIATVSGSTVLQNITAGVVGVVYVLSCAITTSTGQELLLNGYLAVVSNNPFQ